MRVRNDETGLEGRGANPGTGAGRQQHVAGIAHGGQPGRREQTGGPGSEVQVRHRRP